MNTKSSAAELFRASGRLHALFVKSNEGAGSVPSNRSKARVTRAFVTTAPLRRRRRSPQRQQNRDKPDARHPAQRRDVACDSRPGRLPGRGGADISAAIRPSVPQGKIMAIERTFSIIKPDATARNITGAINALIEKAGLRIVGQKRIRMTREQAETFYAVHKARPFFGELVDFMISAPVVVQVLEGEGAIAKYRDVMGATDPSKAADGTIRKLHAKSIGENSVHGSDAADTAAIEIAQFFSGNEIVG
jgi:nucleoside-diphosphate kinase